MHFDIFFYINICFSYIYATLYIYLRLPFCFFISLPFDFFFLPFLYLGLLVILSFLKFFYLRILVYMYHMYILSMFYSILLKLNLLAIIHLAYNCFSIPHNNHLHVFSIYWQVTLHHVHILYSLVFTILYLLSIHHYCFLYLVNRNSGRSYQKALKKNNGREIC